MGGNSALSRFAQNYHQALIRILFPFSSILILEYNRSLRKLGKENRKLKQEFDSLNDDKNIMSESDIPKLKLQNRIGISYYMTKNDYILSEKLYMNSSKERQNAIKEAQKILRTAFEKDPFDASLKIKHPIGPDDNFESGHPAFDAIEYDEILDLLIRTEKYFNIEYINFKQLSIQLKDNVNFDDTLSIMKEINDIAKKLIVETINIYTKNINHELRINEQGDYDKVLVSESFLQNIFLMMSDILNKYNITVCKYRRCNKPVFSSKSRPAQCCCHTHLTSYLRYKQRHSK